MVRISVVLLAILVVSLLARFYYQQVWTTVPIVVTSLILAFLLGLGLKDE